MNISNVSIFRICFALLTKGWSGIVTVLVFLHMCCLLTYYVGVSALARTIPAISIALTSSGLRVLILLRMVRLLVASVGVGTVRGIRAHVEWALQELGLVKQDIGRPKSHSEAPVSKDIAAVDCVCFCPLFVRVTFLFGVDHVSSGMQCAKLL